MSSVTSTRAQTFSLNDSPKNLQDGLKPLSDHIDILLKEIGDDGRAPHGVRSDNESSSMLQQAESFLQIPSCLHSHLKETCENVMSGLLPASLHAIFTKTISHVLVSALSFIATIAETYNSFFGSTTNKNEEEFFLNISSLKHQKILTPKEYIDLKAAYKNSNTDLFERQVIKLSGQLKMDPQSNQHVVGLVRANDPEAAFRFINAFSLLSTLTDNQADDILTPEETEKLENAAKELKGANSFQTSQFIFDIHNSLTTFSWLKKLCICDENDIKSFSTIIKASDENAFAKKLRDHITLKILAFDQDPLKGLERKYLNEISEYLTTYLETPKKSLFKDLSQQYSHELYLNNWYEKINALRELIEKTENDINQNHIETKPEKLEELFYKSLSLYVNTRRILESEDPTISKTLEAAQYGNNVAVWRNVNDLFLKISKGTVAKDHHFVCSCVYGTKLGACPSEEKWKGLPERVAALNSLDKVPDERVDLKSKSILYLTCSMGGGHLAATNAIIHYSQMPNSQNAGRHHVRTLNLPLDVLLPMDPVYNLFGKIFSFMNMDWLYNKLMSHDKCDVLDIMRKMNNKPVSQEVKNATKDLIRRSILKEKPDLLVLNYTLPAEYVFEVAEELAIPIVHTATDFDISGLDSIEHIPLYYKTTIASQLPTMINSLGRDEEFIKEHVEVTGPPLRPEFLKKLSPEEIQKLRKEKGIKDDEQVILFVSGSLGVHSMIPHEIAKWQNPDKPIRLIAVTGKNEMFANELKDSVVPKIVDKANVKFDVLGLTSAEDMSKLMQMSHIVIGKPGGAITSEALYSGARFLGDQTGYRFSWEKFNNDIAIEQGLGNKITSLDEVVTKIKDELALERGKGFEKDKDIANNYVNVMNTMIDRAERDQEFMKIRNSWAIKV